MYISYEGPPSYKIMQLERFMYIEDIYLFIFIMIMIILINLTISDQFLSFFSTIFIWHYAQIYKIPKPATQQLILKKHTTTLSTFIS